MTPVWTQDQDVPGECFVPWCCEDAVPGDEVCARHQRIEQFELTAHWRNQAAEHGDIAAAPPGATDPAAA